MAKPSKNKEKLLLLRRNPLTTRTIFCYSSPLNRNVCEYKVCGRKQAFFVFFFPLQPETGIELRGGEGGGGVRQHAKPAAEAVYKAKRRLLRHCREMGVNLLRVLQ